MSSEKTRAILFSSTESVLHVDPQGAAFEQNRIGESKMSNTADYNDLAIAKELGIEAVSLRDTAKDFDDVWSEFVEKLKASVAAVRAGSTEAPMIRWVLPKPKATVRVPYFVVGLGRGNFWFRNGIHKKGQGLDLIVHRHLIEKLDSPDTLQRLQPYVRAKFEAEQAKGRKARVKRLANATIGYGTVEFVPTAANDTSPTDFVTVSVA
jgi:hypothetical protein